MEISWNHKRERGKVTDQLLKYRSIVKKYKKHTVRHTILLLTLKTEDTPGADYGALVSVVESYPT